MIQRRIAWTIVLVAIFGFLPLERALAEDSSSNQILFSEILWSGSSLSTADEFIELINNTDSVVDLGGYSIFDLVADKHMIEISDGQIAPHGRYLIANYSCSAANSILNIEQIWSIIILV
jgi:hypothetical protein